MRDIQLFNFDEKLPVRIITIKNTPWFVAIDIAKALRYNDLSLMLNHVDNEDQMIFTLYPEQYAVFANALEIDPFKIILINESGVYTLCTTEDEKKFKRYLASKT
jgi:prophage antirepressor-like protein